MVAAFAERDVEKGYVALLNGLPDDGGLVHDDDDDEDADGWRTINSNVVGKEAVTKWRVMNYAKVRVYEERSNELRTAVSHVMHEHLLLCDSLRSPRAWWLRTAT